MAIGESRIVVDKLVTKPLAETSIESKNEQPSNKTVSTKDINQGGVNELAGKLRNIFKTTLPIILQKILKELIYPNITDQTERSSCQHCIE